jgi:hypothetical protein
MADKLAASTDRKLPPMVQIHLWVVSYHLTELFRWLIPDSDNHITMAAASAVLSKTLNELDPDFDWTVWGEGDEE